MGSIKIKGRNLALGLFLFVSFRLFAQNVVLIPQGTVSLAAEISRLEKICSDIQNGTTRITSLECYNAYMDLARLYRLSGNPEGTLRSYEGALTVSPGDNRALLEQGRFLISLGEHEKASAVINVILGNSQNRDFFIQGKYLAAMLEAFRSGGTLFLAALADDPEFSKYRSSIYYTLWKLSAVPSWKNRLTSEFPRSPEARIVNGELNSPPTPLWLLFPGRDSIAFVNAESNTIGTSGQLSAGETSAQRTPSQTVVPAASLTQSIPAETPAAAQQIQVLQTGLFSREENAQALAERLRKAGFAPQITRRRVNGDEFWAVYVPGGNDINSSIMKLKDAGFESFPIKL